MIDTKRLDAYMALQTQGRGLEHRVTYFIVAHWRLEQRNEYAEKLQ